VLAHDCPHITPAHQAHRDEQESAGGAGLVNRDDVRIIYQRRSPGFPDEPAPERPVGTKSGCENLHGHLPAQPLVTGPEHHGHAAVSDLLLQAVAGDHRANPDTVRYAGNIVTV
jgi:hypothetical protein